MTAHQQSEFWAIFLFVVSVFMPLIASAMVPNGWQRIGGAIFALLGIGVMSGILVEGANAMRWGLSLGLVLASIKLSAGLRFL